jgi:hypothetical protein
MRAASVVFMVLAVRLIGTQKEKPPQTTEVFKKAVPAWR